MADDKTKTRLQHALRVKKFGCTAEQLKANVNKTGVMAKAVEAELKRR
jgi:hypothetical protein